MILFISLLFYLVYIIGKKNLTKKTFIVEPSFFTSWTITSKKCTRAHVQENKSIWVYLGLRTCELFLCFVPFIFLGFIVLTSLFSLFYVTGEFNRFLHRG